MSQSWSIGRRERLYEYRVRTRAVFFLVPSLFKRTLCWYVSVRVLACMGRCLFVSVLRSGLLSGTRLP